MSRSQAEETTLTHTRLGFLVCSDCPELSPPEGQELDFDLF